MTSSDTPHQAPSLRERSHGRQRPPQPVVLVFVAIVALVVAALAGCGDDSESTSAPPDGVTELLSAYTNAWASNDEEAFRALVTDDFTLNEFLYQEVGGGLTVGTFVENLSNTAALVRGTRSSPSWQIDHADEQIVVGDGPWYLAVQETWTSPVRVSDGPATYVIVADEDGALKIQAHTWVGLEELIR